MRVQDIILVSDMDGTIIPASGVVSTKNIDALAKFRKLGGTFTIATGRSPASSSEYCKILGIDGAFIANNGASIFDTATQKSVWCRYLDENYKDIVEYVIANFQEVGIELITDDGKYYIASQNNIVKGLVRGTNFDYQYVERKDYPNNCCKVLFVANEDIFRDFVLHMVNYDFPNVVFVESGGECFEMMAENISKGYPLEKLVGYYGKSMENLAAVGDYYNDVEMIAKAKIGAAVENAVCAVKIAANVIVKSCEKDGLADFIDYLIKNSDHNK